MATDEECMAITYARSRQHVRDGANSLFGVAAFPSALRGPSLSDATWHGCGQTRAHTTPKHGRSRVFLYHGLAQGRLS